MTTLMSSEFVNSSDDPEIFFDLPINQMAEELNIDVIYADRLFADMENRSDYRFSRFGQHPNRHQLIAEYLLDQLPVNELQQSISS